MSRTGWTVLGVLALGFGAYAIYRAVSCPLKPAELTDADVDPSELAAGIRVELEHTGDRSTARQIALHHLAEDRRYYSKLGNH